MKGVRNPGLLEIQEGQRLIDRGPYALVRHPMYFASNLLFLGSALVLGSWWGLIPFALFPLSLVFRVRNEEQFLAAKLPGYEEYRKIVRWRLLPFLW